MKKIAIILNRYLLTLKLLYLNIKDFMIFFILQLKINLKKIKLNKDFINRTITLFADFAPYNMTYKQMKN
jgi:hypothetical protein